MPTPHGPDAAREREGRPPGAPDALHWGGLADWLDLVRLPLVFTLVADNLAAALLAGGDLMPITAWLPVLVASLCAYWAGMILNDVVDLEPDRLQRPDRPLAAGRISPAIAGHVGNGLLLIVPVLVLGIVSLHDTHPLWKGAAFLSAIGLSVCVRCYDSWLKRTWLGPLLMGGCRALHLLMVGLTMYSLEQSEAAPAHLFWFASAIGVYVTGVTVYARREAAESAPAVLSAGLMLETVGLVLLAWFPHGLERQHRWHLAPDSQYALLVGLIGITVLHRGLRGIFRPQPRYVQLAVKNALLTLILLDAAVVALWNGPWAAAGIALLVLPALAGGLKLRMT